MLIVTKFHNIAGITEITKSRQVSLLLLIIIRGIGVELLATATVRL